MGTLVIAVQSCINTKTLTWVEIANGACCDIYLSVHIKAWDTRLRVVSTNIGVLDNAGAYSLDDLLVLARLQGIPQGRLALFLFINAERRALLLAWPQEVLDERQRLLTLHR